MGQGAQERGDRRRLGRGKVVARLRSGRRGLQRVLLGALRAHARDARRDHRIQGRGMAQIEEALHEVRRADSRRLAAGEDRGRPGPRAARDSRVKAQDRLLDHLLPVLASRVARKVGRGRNCGCRD